MGIPPDFYAGQIPGETAEFCRKCKLFALFGLAVAIPGKKW